jgi:hypothetical protein
LGRSVRRRGMHLDAPLGPRATYPGQGQA